MKRNYKTLIVILWFAVYLKAAHGDPTWARESLTNTNTNTVVVNSTKTSTTNTEMAMLSSLQLLKGCAQISYLGQRELH